LPASTYPAFREAVEAMRQRGFVGSRGRAVNLKRRMVERVLTGCADEALVDIGPLPTLLRQFAAAEAAPLTQVTLGARSRPCSAAVG
jgi:hypothetical protein